MGVRVERVARKIAAFRFFKGHLKQRMRGILPATFALVAGMCSETDLSNTTAGAHDDDE